MDNIFSSLDDVTKAKVNNSIHNLDLNESSYLFTKEIINKETNGKAVIYSNNKIDDCDLKVNVFQKANNCKIFIGHNSTINGCEINLYSDDALVYIGCSSLIYNLKLVLNNSSGYILIGNKVEVRGENHWTVGSTPRLKNNGVIIGDNTILSPHITIKASDEYLVLNNEDIQMNTPSGPVLIESYCYISELVNINKSVTLGACSIVHTHTNVHESFPRFSNIYGNPAKAELIDGDSWILNNTDEAKKTKNFYVEKFSSKDKTKKFKESNYSLQKDVELTLSNWEFTSALNKLRRTLDKEDTNLAVFVKFCMDLGYLDDAFHALKARNKNGTFVFDFISSKPKYWKIVENCWNLNISSEENSNIPDHNKYFYELMMLSKCHRYKELLLTIKNASEDIINPNIDSEANMLLSYAVHNLIDSDLLDDQTGIKLTFHIYNAKNINPYRRRNLILTLVNYFSHKEATTYFSLPTAFTNHLHRLLHILQRSSNSEPGAKALSNKLKSLIRNNNNLNIKNVSNRKKKVAICVSGMFKIDDSAMQSLYKNIAEPLDADIFIHTWDTIQIWSGEARKSGFWSRQFKYSPTKLPPEIHNMDRFCELFPNSGKILLSTIDDKLANHFTPENKRIKKYLVEDDKEALSKWIQNESFSSRGHFNQFKMYYGIKKSLDLVKEYENDNNVKYDVIIRTRPDLFIKSELNHDWLKQLDQNSMIIRFDKVGPSDQFFCALRNDYESFISIWDMMNDAKQLSPFEEYSQYDSHVLLYAWLCYKNFDLKNIDDCFYDVSFTSSSAKIPGLKEAINSDLKKFKIPEEYLGEYNALFDFLKERSL